jgi:hypothetical protein
MRPRTRLAALEEKAQRTPRPDARELQARLRRMTDEQLDEFLGGCLEKLAAEFRAQTRDFDAWASTRFGAWARTPGLGALITRKLRVLVGGEGVCPVCGRSDHVRGSQPHRLPDGPAPTWPY